MTLANLSYHRMFSNKREGDTCLKSICFSFQKIFFVLKLTTK